MKKKAYIKPLTEAIKVNGKALMETWSIGVDNNPDHGIGAGDEDDIGAKEGFYLYYEEDTPTKHFNVWDD